MNFIINPKALQKELAFVQGVVERKNTIPVLANILIESIGSDAVRISGTDLDVTIRADVNTEQVKEQGSICVQARKLFDIARLLPDAPVTFKKEENDWVTVQCGKSNFRLPGISSDTFPDLPGLGLSSNQSPDPAASKTPFAITSSVMKTLINQTIFAITQEEGRYTLSGAKFEIQGDEITIVTTDGHRLAFIRAKGELKNTSKETLDLLIPKKTLSELTKLANDFDGDISFGADENHVFFQIGNRSLVSRLLSGQFPNYEMVLPKNNDRSATFNTAEFAKALRRVALMADDRSHAVVFTLNNNTMVISARNSEDGEADESLATEFKGDELKVGFNASYIQDVLNAVTSEQIIMELKDGNTQVEFKPVTDNDQIEFRSITMPVRL